MFSETFDFNIAFSPVSNIKKPHTKLQLLSYLSHVSIGTVRSSVCMHLPSVSSPCPICTRGWLGKDERPGKVYPGSPRSTFGGWLSNLGYNRYTQYFPSDKVWQLTRLKLQLNLVASIQGKYVFPFWFPRLYKGRLYCVDVFYTLH